MEVVDYTCTRETFRPSLHHAVRWLDWHEDYPLMQAFREPVMPLALDEWLGFEEQGYQYCGIVVDGALVCIAAVWRFQETKWMLAAVMTKPELRRHGYAKAVCSFITAHILDSGRIAVATTALTNVAMQRTAESIGYQRDR